MKKGWLLLLLVVLVTIPWWVATYPTFEQAVTAPRPREPHWEIRVSGYQAYANDDGFTPRPTPAHGEYLLVSLEVTNTDQEAWSLFDRGAVVETVDGRLFSYAYPLAMAGKTLEGKPVQPGETVRGVMSFDFEPGAIPSVLRWYGKAATFPPSES